MMFCICNSAKSNQQFVCKCMETTWPSEARKEWEFIGAQPKFDQARGGHDEFAHQI